MNILDRVIAWVSPTAGERRARARYALRHYEGATSGRRLSGRNKATGDANAALQAYAGPLRYAARDLVRNNAWASRGLTGIVTNTVGSGIMAAPRTPNKARTKRVRDAFNAWALQRIDLQNRLDFYGVQQLVLRTVAESGEAFVVKSASAQVTGAPLAVKVLEPEWLDTSRIGDGLVDGIEYAADGRPLVYWFFDSAPISQLMPAAMTAKSSPVPASDVIHVYRVDRPGQRRGVTWFAPVIVDMHDLDGFEDAVLLRAKMAACHVGTLVQPDGFSGSAAGIQASIGERLEPGAIDIAPPGYDMRYNSPPDSGDYVPFTKQRLRRLAAGLGLSYEALTGDLSETNFASGRMGWLEMHRSIEAVRWHMLIPQLCDGIAKWWAELSGLAGVDATGVTWNWTPPRREIVDPSREIPAMVDAVRGGIKSLQEVHREIGHVSEDVLAEISETAAELDRLQIKITSDARNPLTGSAIQQTAPQQAQQVSA